MARGKKLLVITGPTATGKTKLGITLARKYSGEIISADSRQVYKFMDIGTGKDREAYQKVGIYVWGIDLVDPDYHFNVSDWAKYAQATIVNVWKQGKLPIIVGGTGQYIRSLLDPPETLGVPINKELRRSLSNCSIVTLQQKLIEVDKRRWEGMNKSDRKNPRRLVRAIEVANQNKKLKIEDKKYRPNIKMGNALIIGLTAERKILNERIDHRVEERIKMGMEEEVNGLLVRGYSWDLASMSSLGYREFRDYSLAPSPSLLAAGIEKWKIAEHQYAKRQMTYLKKYLPEIRWFEITQKGFEDGVTRLVEKFVL